uniref:Uncharacterized protein n=1 Tax=Chenopodium quinoa TaxID=63459 RepID=A0A803MS00_CHEQI
MAKKKSASNNSSKKNGITSIVNPSSIAYGSSGNVGLRSMLVADGMGGQVELVHSPLVHPSVGLITREDHENLMEQNRVLGIPMVNSESNGTVPRSHNLGFKQIWLPNLPLNCWSADSLSKIVSTHGVPLFGIDCTTRQQRVSFARILVEMDVTMTLPDHVWIKDGMGIEFKQKIIHCEIVDHSLGHSFLFSTVYGLHTIDSRKALWAELGSIYASIGNQAWLIARDFNTMLIDRVNGAPVTMHEIHGVSTNTASRIDWCLGNTEWMMNEGDIVAEYLNPSISDHSPILMDCIDNAPGGGRPFKFIDYLADHKDFIPIVKACWSNEVRGTAVFFIWSRLKMIKGKLKACIKRNLREL